ncbi:MAG: methyltransferase domain-containing protein [Chitinophagales bacterium]
METTQQEKVSDYNKDFEERDYQKRTKKAQHLTDNYYTLVTNFYEKGWGQSFHFAPRYKGEDFKSSILRHEHFLASQLGLCSSDKVLDLGCGIMGPARNIARVSGAYITGLTINVHQVERAKTLNRESGIDHLLQVVQGDFMEIPFPDNSFDKIYAIEALCHAPNLIAVYKQALSKLKPGGMACFYEWAMTDQFNPSNPEHIKIKEMIEYGNGIAELKTIAEIDKAIEAAGFEQIENIDLLKVNYGNNVPWYSTLQSGWSLSQIRHTKASRTIVHYMLRTLEKLNFVKKGVSKAQKILLVAADGLVAGGEQGIFTPIYMVKVKKPKV